MTASVRPAVGRALRGLTVLFVALSVAACQTLMGPGTFEAKINGAQLDDVVSAYLVVADDADLADLADVRTIDKLVRPERQAKYITFAQLKPALTDAWRFEIKASNPTHKAVKVKVSAKAAEATLAIDRGLLEARPNLAAAVLVNCGPKGWGASAKIARTEIENVDQIGLEIRGLSVNRVGGN